MRDILEASTGIWLVLFSLVAFSGLRSSEIRALAWATIDLEGGEIEVVRRADWSGQIGPCKSDAAKRKIQIPDQVVDLLRWWKPICPPSAEGLVCPDDNGNIIPGTKILEQLYVVEVEIKMVRPNKKPKYTVHSLRHFYASIMIFKGTDLKRLQELLGHASIALTMDTYGHLFPAGEAEKRRANEAFAAVFPSGTKTVGTPSSSTTTGPASASLSIAIPAAPPECPVPDSAVAVSRIRPTLGTGSPREFGHQGAAVLPRAPASNRALISESELLKLTPGRGTKDDVFVVPGVGGWVVTIGARTLGRYRSYGEAHATVRQLRGSEQSAH